MNRFCLALDLKDDPVLIAEYEQWHQQVWPEVESSIRNSGIQSMDIWRYSNRLFMIIEANDDFSFAAKDAADASNDKVQEWERLMWNYQQSMPGAKEGEKWVFMSKIFSLG